MLITVLKQIHHRHYPNKSIESFLRKKDKDINNLMEIFSEISKKTNIKNLLSLIFTFFKEENKSLNEKNKSLEEENEYLTEKNKLLEEEIKSLKKRYKYLKKENKLPEGNNESHKKSKNLKKKYVQHNSDNNKKDQILDTIHDRPLVLLTKEKKHLIIAYVHGFKGDENTFGDLPELLKKNFGAKNIEINNEIFKPFETKGEFDIIVNRIIEWIYEIADNKPIVLMGHSMGGILVADAFRKISKGSIPKYRYSNHPNIIGVFGFDSPYFGLTNSVYGAGIKKVGETISSVSNYMSSYLSNNKNDNSLDQTSNLQFKTSENNPNGEKKRGWSYGDILFGAMSLGYIIYKRDAVYDKSNKIIAEGTGVINDYRQFLEPLSDVNEQHARMNDIVKFIKRSLSHGKKQFMFKNYYPITSLKTENGLIKQHFISLPSDKKYLKYFDAICASKNSTDVINSHINMFKLETNKKYVQILADKCTNDIYQLIKNIL
eukprot:jgi/Orpsp1_1/1174240/evm.model.c7180000049376.2